MQSPLLFYSLFNINKMAQEEKVKKTDLTTVYGTGKSKNMPLGKEYKVHKLVAEKLLKSGKASKEQTKGKESKK